MGNEVILNKDGFKDSNGTEYELRELENYDFSNDWGWECKEYCKITDIYKKTFFDAAISELNDLRKEYDKSEKEYTNLIKSKDESEDLIKSKKEYVDFIGIGKEYAEYCQWLLRKDEKPTNKTDSNCILVLPDPDSESLLLRKIYGELWVDKYLEECKSSGIIKGETMNSIWTTLNEAYKFIESQKQTKQREREWGRRVSKEYLLCRYAESMLNGEFVSNLDKIRGLRTFLESAHMLGNFIPVPVGCNAPRGTGALQDYWDLTLKVIYDYYAHKEEGKTDTEYYGNICKIVGAENVDKYKAWLDLFENWDNFVQKNYMRAFVNIKKYDEKKYNDNEHYGVPKELWDGHFDAFSGKEILRKKVLPENTKQAEQFFERASFCIHERSLDMIAELEKVLNEEES